MKEFEHYIDFISVKAVEAGYEEASKEIALEQLKPFESTMKFEFDENLFKSAASKIKVNFLPGTKFIDHNTYGQLVDGVFDCIKDKYVELIKTSRKEQRKNINNHKVYFDLINSSLTNSESLIIEGQRKLYGLIGCDSNKWENNGQILLERGGGQFMMMAQTGLR